MAAYCRSVHTEIQSHLYPLPNDIPSSCIRIPFSHQSRVYVLEPISIS